VLNFVSCAQSAVPKASFSFVRIRHDTTDGGGSPPSLCPSPGRMTDQASRRDCPDIPPRKKYVPTPGPARWVQYMLRELRSEFHDHDKLKNSILSSSLRPRPRSQFSFRYPLFFLPSFCVIEMWPMWADGPCHDDTVAKRFAAVCGSLVLSHFLFHFPSWLFGFFFLVCFFTPFFVPLLRVLPTVISQGALQVSQ